MRAAGLIVFGVLCCACEPELGGCDPVGAETVVFDRANGSPAFEGQAVMIQSCANRGICHAAGDDPVLHRGVPRGLWFDVQLSGVDSSVDHEAITRQRHGRFRVLQEARHMLAVIDDGTMPPPSPVGDAITAGGPVYVYRADAPFDDGGLDGGGLDDGGPAGELDGGPPPPPRPAGNVPFARQAAGREALRNWLACGAPIIERSVAREDRVPAVVEPALPIEPLEPTWVSIYTSLLQQRCAGSACHGFDPRSGFEITDDPGETRANLLREASGEDCGLVSPRPRLVVEGMPEQSLLLDKLGGAPGLCGDRMPSDSIPVSPDDLAAIRDWIVAGAPE